jgi:tRNA threonylcarbamoyladenosine biosynthesis protein TsaE
MKIDVPDAAAMEKLGGCIARHCPAGAKVFLQGALGAGKTTLVRGFLRELGYCGVVKSPTYTLAEPYTVELAGEPVEVVHFDLYRMAGPDEFLDAGFRDYFNHRTVCIIEWPEKAGDVLPPPDINVFLTMHGEGRKVELQALSPHGSQCLERLHFAPNL